MEFAEPEDTLANVAARMAQLGISQMPVNTKPGEPHLLIHEVDILQGLISGECTPQDTVMPMAKKLEGQVGTDDALSKVQSVFDEHNVAIVVDEGSIIGVISKIDVVGFLAARS